MWWVTPCGLFPFTGQLPQQPPHCSIFGLLLATYSWEPQTNYQRAWLFLVCIMITVVALFTQTLALLTESYGKCNAKFWHCSDTKKHIEKLGAGRMKPVPYFQNSIGCYSAAMLYNACVHCWPKRRYTKPEHWWTTQFLYNDGYLQPLCNWPSANLDQGA